jgi:hypothetical protein
MTAWSRARPSVTRTSREYRRLRRLVPHCALAVLRPLAAHVGHVDHVVVQQGGGVQELDGVAANKRSLSSRPRGFAAGVGPVAGAANVYRQRSQCSRHFLNQRYARYQWARMMPSTKIFRHHAIERLGLHRLHLLNFMGCAAC